MKPKWFFNRLIFIAVFIILIIGGVLIYYLHATNQTSQKQQSFIQTKNNQTTNQNNQVSVQPITTSSIVSLLNQERVSKGLSAFKWITQLDTAALARAKYMVANNSTSITLGDPGADITDANYSDSDWDLSATWNETNLQDIVTSFTTGNDLDFGFSTKYSDLGLAIVPDTVDGNSTQLIVVYLANQATTVTNKNNQNKEYPPDYYICPPGETGVWPNCITPTCPFGDTGIYPDCIVPECDPGFVGTYPNCELACLYYNDCFSNPYL